MRFPAAVPMQEFWDIGTRLPDGPSQRALWLFDSLLTMNISKGRERIQSAF